MQVGWPPARDVGTCLYDDRSDASHPAYAELGFHHLQVMPSRKEFR